MTEFLLLLSLWPFHHKKPNDVFVYHAEDYDRSCECEVDFQMHFEGGAVCETTGNVWLYTTDDGVIGIGASCEAAKKDWNSAHIDPVRMSRS